MESPSAVKESVNFEANILAARKISSFVLFHKTPTVHEIKNLIISRQTNLEESTLLGSSFKEPRKDLWTQNNLFF